MLCIDISLIVGAHVATTSTSKLTLLQLEIMSKLQNMSPILPRCDEKLAASIGLVKGIQIWLSFLLKFLYVSVAFSGFRCKCPGPFWAHPIGFCLLFETPRLSSAFSVSKVPPSKHHSETFPKPNLDTRHDYSAFDRELSCILTNITTADVFSWDSRKSPFL